MCVCVCVYVVQSTSVVSDCVIPWTVALQTPLSMGFSRQEYWKALPFPPPGDLPNPGIGLKSLTSPALAGGLLTTVPPGKPQIFQSVCVCVCVLLSRVDSL